MQRCQNCYNSWFCKEMTPELYEKHKDEDTTSCLKFENDSEDYED